jgi:zinc protease
VLRQTADTYTSDVLLFLLTSPVGRFKTALMDRGPGLYDPEYIDFNYPTARDGGAYGFSAYMLLDDAAKDGPGLDRVEALRELVIREFKTIAADPRAYFGEAELATAKTKLIDQNLLVMEKAGDFVTNTLSFWWSVATADYFFGYEDNCSKVSFDDITDLIGRYLVDAPVASIMRLNTAASLADPSMKERASALGYAFVDPEAAFWWQK